MKKAKSAPLVGSPAEVGAKKRRAKETKLTLQLVPSNITLKERLRGLGLNPFVQITFKASKPISFIVDYVLRRRYGQHISADNQRSASVTFAAGEKLWTRQDRNLPMREVFAVLSQPYRLTYCFDEGILEGASEAGATSNAEAFEAKTRNATTLFDASNSIFNSAMGGLGDISLGFNFFGESSLLGAPVAAGTGTGASAATPAAPLAPAASTAGPLASQFEIENSFGSFLTSPLGGGGVVTASNARNEPSEAKRSLFD